MMNSFAAMSKGFFLARPVDAGWIRVRKGSVRVRVKVRIKVRVRVRVRVRESADQ